MKKYRELCFKGEVLELKKFFDDIKEYSIENWGVNHKKNNIKEDLYFYYFGDDIPKCIVSINLSGIQNHQLNVGNITLEENKDLTTTEYNDILAKFYEEVIVPRKNSGKYLINVNLSNDIFNPLDEISEESLEKLREFCNLANKSTGSSHPNDRDRWFDFICQTVDDDRIINAATLRAFLKDEEYWVKKPEGYMGSMGEYAWDEERANSLAAEYEIFSEIIAYYKKRKGL